MNISIDLKNIGRKLLNERPEVILSGKKRLQNLDALKLMSLVLVLCVHCAQHFYSLVEGSTIWSITRFIYCCGVIAIPIFFMVSGYQLLGRKDVSYRYVFAKIMKILRTAFILYLFVQFLRWLLLDKKIVVVDIPMQFCLNLFQKGDYGFMWFVGGLCLIYLVLPLLNWFYRERKSQFLWIAIVLIGIMSLFFFFHIVRPSGVVVRVAYTSQTLRLWNWLGYFCLGGLIKRYDVFDNLGRWSLVMVLTVGCFIFLNLIAEKRNVWFFEHSYASLPVVFFAISVFLAVMKLGINSVFIEKIAVVFMPAYLLGPVFMFWIEGPMLLLPEVIAVIVFVAVNGALALTTGWLLMKTPVVKNLLKL